MMEAFTNSNRDIHGGRQIESKKMGNLESISDAISFSHLDSQNAPVQDTLKFQKYAYPAVTGNLTDVLKCLYLKNLILCFCQTNIFYSHHRKQVGDFSHE